jgi:DNA-binding NarL/FixJ family response regulator
MIKLLIADDHQMLKDGLIALLKDNKEIEIVAEASNGIEVLEMMNKYLVDVVILDINMPIMDGIVTCRKIKQMHPLVKILVLTMYDEGKLISKIVKNGATGYILKNTGKEKLIEAIKTVHNGGTYFSEQVKAALIASLVSEKSKNNHSYIPILTRREKEIIELIVYEYTTHEIAEKLFISEKTVETHRKNLLQKLNTRNTAGLVRVAIQRGLVE